MTATTYGRRADHAMLAWHEGRRRRRIAGAAERGADAALAAGGLVLANATLPLGFGLPAGHAGISIGMGLVCAGVAWITRHRGRTNGTPQHATAAQVATVIRLADGRAA